MEKNQQRIYSLDIAKALCIVLVVVGISTPTMLLPGGNVSIRLSIHSTCRCSSL